MAYKKQSNEGGAMKMNRNKAVAECFFPRTALVCKCFVNIPWGIRRFTIVAMAVPVLSGCPTWVQNHAYKDYRPSPLVDKPDDSKSIAKDDTFGSLVEALQRANYLAPSCFMVTSSQASAAAAVSAPNPASYAVQTVNQLDCRTQRNYIVTLLVNKSNDTCQAHKATIFGNEASWNVALGSLTNVFTGTAAVVGGPVGKSIFSALGLFTNAERSLINEEVYQNLLVPAIGDKIDEIRSAKLSSINTNVKADIDTYTMSQAISDVIEYHNDCSFMLGLQLALKEGTAGGLSTQYNTLVRVEQSLTSQIDGRKSQIAGQKPPPADLQAAYSADDLLTQLKTRLDSVEAQLKVLETLPASKAASGS